MNKLVKQAFTLIELLVVIAIIGILSGLIIVSMGGVTSRASIAKGQVFANSLRNSLMANIVAQYSFDDIDSSDYDPSTKIVNNDVGNIPDSWLSNEGRAYNGPILKEGSDCISGKCLSFDGTDDYVDLGDMPIIENANILTISFWLKVTTISTLKGLIAKATGGALSDASFAIETGTTPGSSILFGIPTSTTDSYGFTAVGTIVANSWYNVTCVFDGGQTGNINRLKIYINGEAKILGFSGTIPTTIQATSTNLNFGRYADGTRYFQGLMDDIRIYNAVLPTSQIKEQYYAGLNKLLSSGGITQEEYQDKMGNLATRL